MRLPFIVFCCALASGAPAQTRYVPFVEHFDSVSPPALPGGWLTTFARSTGGDFTTTHSVPLSDSNAVISTDAAVGQALTSPHLDFTGRQADSITFYERRSSSHNSGLLIEASTDGGNTFPIRMGDTLKNPGTASYVRRALALSGSLSRMSSVRLRWRVAGDGTGTAGTIRFDDVMITGRSMIDASIQSVVLVPPDPRAGDPASVVAVVGNSGFSEVPGFTVNFYVDANDDSFPDPAEEIGSASSEAALRPGDSVAVESGLSAVGAGLIGVISIVHASGDENPLNDTLRTTFPVAYRTASVVINEIMYDPLIGGAEYVELFNPGSQAVDLRGWSIADAAGLSASGGHVIGRSSILLGPGGYFVVASDSSIFRRFAYLMGAHGGVIIKPGAFSLNNSGDAVVLRDFTQSTVDSVRYIPGWHNQEIEDPSGRSLERINPLYQGNDARNWGTSASPLGGTPGRQNTLFASSRPPASGISCSPNPFSPDGDGFEDVTVVTYHLSATSGIIRVRIYDSRGRLVRTLADGEPSGAVGGLIWDGFDNDRRRARMGVYIILLEARGGNGEIIQEAKATVVVAAKL